MVFQILRHLQGVFTVPGHPQMQGFQSDVQQEGVHGRLDGAKIPHELGGRLGDIRLLPEFFRIDDAVIGLVRRAQSRKFVRIQAPVKIAGIHDGPAHAHGMAVHIFGGGMGHDIRSPLKGIAVDGRGKGIVHDQRDLVRMGRLRELFNVQDHQRGVGDGLRKHALRILLKGRAERIIIGVRIHDAAGDSHLLHGIDDQVEGTAVNGGGKHHMVSRLTDVEHGVMVGRLSGGSEHGSHAALQLADLLRHAVVGGILQSGVEIAFLLQIEQPAHLLGGLIFKGRALINGKHARLPVLRLPAGLNAYGFLFVWFFHLPFSLCYVCPRPAAS